MRTAIYPGSFDPVTFGHLDLIRRASLMVDRLVVGVLHNSSKQPLFSDEERVDMIREVTKDLPNVEVIAFSGLLVDFADTYDAKMIVRGLRAVSDFEYELMWAQTNRMVKNHLDTMFLVTSPEYSNISSSAVRELYRYGCDVSQFVPAYVAEKLITKIKGE